MNSIMDTQRLECFLSQLFDFLQCVAEDHIVTLKCEISQKLLFLQHQREPQDVIRPHLAEGNLMAFKPLWLHLCKTGEQQVKHLSLNVTADHRCD